MIEWCSSVDNVDIALRKSQIITKMELNILSDPNINYNIMENEITNTNRKYIIKKTVRFIKYKHTKSEWITRGILCHKMSYLRITLAIYILDSVLFIEWRLLTTSFVVI